MEKTAADLEFTLAHIGINTESSEASLALAEQFFGAFGFPVKEGNSSNFAGTGIEVMKKQYKGRNGHIAIGTTDIYSAMEYLRDKGFHFDMDTAKYKDDALIAVYLEEDFGGFAVHLVRQKQK